MGFLGLGKNHPRETEVPPPSLAPPPNIPGNIAGVISGNRVPPTYVYTQRREPNMGPSFLMAPWDNYDTFYDLNIGWHEAPDPIRQSDFWAAGNKVNPQARMPIVTNLAIGSIESVDEQTFRIGKLIGYMRRPMYAGMQQPSVIRANIQEALPSTYGSQYEVRGVHPANRGVAPTGFILPVTESLDGYPY